MLLCLVTFYLLLIEKKSVLLLRQQLACDFEVALLHFEFQDQAFCWFVQSANGFRVDPTASALITTSSH